MGKTHSRDLQLTTDLGSQGTVKRRGSWRRSPYTILVFFAENTVRVRGVNHGILRTSYLI